MIAIPVDMNDLLRIMVLCNLTDRIVTDADVEAFARLYDTLTKHGTKGVGVELHHRIVEAQMQKEQQP